MSTGKVSSTDEFAVRGMTCEHCVRSVTEELQEIAGVTAVRVDLATGSVNITSDKPVAAADVQAAVEEAGYQLA